MPDRLRIFGLNHSKEYAAEVCRHLDIEVAEHKERSFADGEVYFRSNQNVRGRDVYVVQSLYTCDRASVNDRLVSLMWAVGSLRDAAAARITVIVPYMGYARMDRKVHSREPVTTRYMAQVLEAQGVDRVVTFDIHQLAAFQNAFRIHTDHLEAKKLLAGRVYEGLTAGEADFGMCVVTDIGGIDRGSRFARHLAKITSRRVTLCPCEKYHEGDEVRVERVIGDVKGKVCILLDDMIGSGATVAQEVKAVQAGGGKVWGVAATHGLFVGDRLEEFLAGVPKIVVTDTISRLYALPTSVRRRVEVISTAKLVADAIRRNHEGTGSISELLE